MSKIFLATLGITTATSLGALSTPVQAGGFGDWMNPGKWFSSRDRDYDRDGYYRGYYPYGGYGYPGYGYPGYGYPGWGAPGWGAPGWGYGGYPMPQQQSNNTPPEPRTPQ